MNPAKYRLLLNVINLTGFYLVIWFPCGAWEPEPRLS